VLGVLLVVALVFLEGPAEKLGAEREAMQKAGLEAPRTPEQLRFIEAYRWNWMTFLVVLLVVIVLAGIDLCSLGRPGMKQRRKLNGDGRAMLQRQLPRLRQERDERN